MRKLLPLFLIFVFVAGAQSSASSIADSLFATGHYTKAINYYARIASSNSSIQIARAYTAIGNFEKAVAQYRSVVKLHPSLQIASFELGKLLVKTKDYDKARKLFSKLVGIGKDNPEYYYYLGEVYRELEQPASSIVAYKKAINRDSTHLRSLFQLGKYFVMKQLKNQALPYIEKGLEFYPNDLALINLKALAFFNNDEYDKAMPLFERLVELGERKEYIYTKLAYCQFKSWELEKAKKSYKVLLAIDDANADAYFHLGHVFWKDRKLDSARFYINRSTEVQKPVLWREYESLARLARVEENLKGALKYYQMAHAEDPLNPMTYYNVCTLTDQVYGDPKTSLEYYEAYMEKFGTVQPYITDFVTKRIRQLKEEIHFTSD